MRILKITLTNLNSLKGTWEINLEDPAYVSNGIFAICGPTGAGKSSLLDAVSLALYQCTPRQGHITSTSNEVMTRGTGTCTSEVTFEAAGDRYRARWSQNRARGKAEGRLQGASHELAKLNRATGEWDLLPAKMSEIPAKIEAITGMGADQFSRSMLLAQGNFAAFMKAPAQARAQALENITGTEIYTRISQRVQQKYSAFAADLQNLKSTLSGMVALTPEALAQKRAQKDALSENLKKVQEDLAGVEAALDWRKKLSDLQTEVAAIEKDCAASQEKLLALAPEKPQLEAAQRAAILNEDFAVLSRERTERATLADESSSHAATEAATRQALSSSETADKSADKQAVASEKALESLRAVVREVRDLDTRLAQARTTLNEREERKAKTEKAFKDNDDALRALEDSLEKAKTKLTALAARLSPETPQARLWQQRQAVQEALTVAQNRKADLASIASDAKKKSEAADTARKHSEALAPKEAQALQAQQKAAGALEALVKQSRELLGGRTLEAISLAQGQLAERRSLLGTALEKAKSIGEARRQLAANEEKLAKANADAKAFDEEGGKVLSLIRSLEQNLADLAEKARLKDLIEQLADERARLADGAPCPLCGSLHHPWVHEKPAASVDLEKERTLKVELASQQKRLTEVQGAAAASRTRAETLAAAIERARAALADETRSFANLFGQIFPDASLSTENLAAGDALPEEELKAELARVTEALSREKLLAEQALTLAKSRAKAEQDEADARKALEACREERRQALEALAAAQALAKGALETLASARTQAQQAMTTVTDLAVGAGFDVPAFKAPEEARTFLTPRIAAYESDLEAQKTLQGAIEVEARDRSNKLQRKTELAQELAKAQGDVKASADVVAELTKQRIALFGDRNPDVEEAAAQKAAQAAHDARERARKALALAQQAVKRFEDKRDALAERIKKKEETLAALELAFKGALSQAGFESEALWSAARMAPEALKDRQSVHAKAEAEAQRHEANLRDRRTQLAAEEQKAVTSDSVEVLTEKKTADKGRIEEFSQQIGAIAQELKSDEELRSRQKATLDEIARREKDIVVWERLNALIGAYDGKKYREFVQSITFETLIEFANESLVKMTDRYILTSSPNELLAFDVIDNYQGGVVRSSSNLSGGETFIASLALALGLSRMASRNVQVDSLFLDEGFGTLDPEALDNTLGMLSTLNEQGKLIGIISHVGEIRERIPARIDVIPVTGGVSRLEGPGVREIVRQ